MSRSEESMPAIVAEQLRLVATFWDARLPEAFCNLYKHFQHPFLAPCEFFALDAIARGVGRGFGMLPQFLPIGRAVGDGGLYGFYITPDTIQGRWPVLYWDEDEMYLRPVASDFDAFLRYCVTVGRYETEAQWPDDAGDPQDEADRRQWGRYLGLPNDVLFGPVPRNDTELYERLACSDPQDAVSLCHLGCTWRARGDSERALDFFHRAIEVTPWFGDPAYLMADIYRERGKMSRAVQGWWAVAQCLLPLCTRTWEWDLGADHPEADIYEVAADGIAQNSEETEPGIRSLPLWHVVLHDDPYDPDVREALGDAYLAQNQPVAAEREYLNALSLCYAERSKQPERLYDALIALYDRQGRSRDASLARYDRALPRPTV